MTTCDACGKKYDEEDVSKLRLIAAVTKLGGTERISVMCGCSHVIVIERQTNFKSRSVLK